MAPGRHGGPLAGQEAALSRGLHQPPGHLPLFVQTVRCSSRTMTRRQDASISSPGWRHPLPTSRAVRAGVHGAAAVPTLGCAGQSPTVAVSPRGTMQPAFRKEAAYALLRLVSSRCAHAAARARKEALAGDTGHALGLVS